MSYFVLVLVAASLPVVQPNGNTDWSLPALGPGAECDSPPGWNADTLLSINDVQESREPHLAIDGQGRLHAVWKDNRRLHGRDEVHYRCKDSTGWSDIFSVGNLDTVHNWPDVSIDASDDIHVCFMRWYGVPYAYYDLGYRKRDGATGDWADEERLTVDDSLGFAAYPQTVCVADTVFVFWQKERTSPQVIWYVYNNGSGWTERQRLTAEDCRPNGYFDVTTSTQGWIHAVWQDVRTDTNQLWHRFHDGDSWSEPVRVTFHGFACIQPSICADSGGDLHLTYCGGGPEQRIHYRIWDQQTQVWGPDTAFYSWSGTPYPKVGVNLETGERHLTHVGHQEIWCLAYRRYDPGTSQWTDSVMLTWYNVATGPAEPKLDADGYVHLVFWDQRYGSQEEIQYKSNRVLVGIEEAPAAKPGSRLVWPSVAGSRLWFAGKQPAWVYDASGRPMLELQLGENRLGTIPAGVYFVETAEGTDKAVLR